MLIDTHCHLNMSPLGQDRSGVLERARARGVTRLVLPAYDLVSWPDVLELGGAEGVFPALGLHPWVADQCQGGEQLKDQLGEAVEKAEGAVVAIGEIGLDTKVDSPNLEVQMPILRAQLEVAADLDLPVILHCRGAFHALIAEVNRFDGKIRGIIHAWTRGPELVKAFYPTGLLFGLGGAITRPTAKQARRSAKVIPLHRIVLETDAPSIGLDGVRPENTEPHHVADVAAALAEIRGVALAAIASETTRNAESLFNLDFS